MSRTSVELHQAFFWACDECGRDNYARTVTVPHCSLSDEDRRELAEEFGGRFERDVVICTAPDTVTCSHCGMTFDAEDAS